MMEHWQKSKVEDLGLMLLEKKIITQSQLSEAVMQQKIKGGYLSQHLINLGYLKDTGLTAFLTCRYGYAYLPIKCYDIPKAALDSIPAQINRDFCILPLEKTSDLLTITMVDPSNKGVLDIVKETTHCKIAVFISTRHEINEALEKYYQVSPGDFQLDKFHQDEMLRENLQAQEYYAKENSSLARRRYKRFNTKLVMDFFSRRDIKTDILNISMNGILFDSEHWIPNGTQMAVNIFLSKDNFITAVIEVVRSKPKKPFTVFSKKNIHDYCEVGAFFTFMSQQDQQKLAEFLKEKIKK
ncbi:MAG: PilZ domain-containing protein [Candidatus Omnitrophota bacterium]